MYEFHLGQLRREKVFFLARSLEKKENYSGRVNNSLVDAFDAIYYVHN